MKAKIAKEAIGDGLQFTDGMQPPVDKYHFSENTEWKGTIFA